MNNKIKWVLCSQQIPKICEIVLVTDGRQIGLGMISGLYKESLWVRPVHLDILSDITAWAYLPALPRYIKRLSKKIYKDKWLERRRNV